MSRSFFIIFSVVFVFFLGTIQPQSVVAIQMANPSHVRENILAIVDDGAAQAVVVIEDNVNLRIKKGADALVEYVEKSTGVKLRVITTKTYEENKEDYGAYTRIFVDTVPAAYEADIAAGLQNLDDQGFLIYPREKVIIITGPTIWGTLNGVHEFLERYVGVRWLMIGPAGEDVPTLNNINVPMISVRGQPAFSFRVLWNPFNGGDPYNPFTNNRLESEWAHRNKLQGNYNYGIHFDHNLHTVFPPEKFGATNPEFYPKSRAPEPGDIRRWQPCFTVPETIDVAVEHIIDYFDNHPHEISFSLGVNDIGGYCEEDPAHPHYSSQRNSGGYIHLSDIYYRWVNEVVERVTQVYPDKWFGLKAYREVVDPPSFPLHPRVIPRIARDRMTWIDEDIRDTGHRQMEAWKEVANQVVWADYMYGFPYHVPRVFPRLMSEVFRYAGDQQIMGWSIENTYHVGEGPKAWILAKLLWDPHQDIDALLAEWYERVVGPDAADDLAAFYDHWEHFWTKRIPGTRWFETGKIGTYLRFPDPSYLEYVTEEDIEKSKKLLDSVVTKAQTEKQKIRAGLIREAFDFYDASALSYPKEIDPPRDEQSALAFIDELVRIIDQRIEFAHRRYKLQHEFRRHSDRNMWIRAALGGAFFEYWWKDWTGWNNLDLRKLVNYLNVYERLGGPVTDRIKKFTESEDRYERQIALLIQMVQGAYIQAPSLTTNSSFENDGDVPSPWTIHMDGNGTIKRSEDIAFTGHASLRFGGVGRGSVAQVFQLDRGLTAVQVHYYTPPDTQSGTIRFDLEGRDARGKVLASFSTPRKSFSDTVGEWASLELVDVLLSGLNRDEIVEGRVIVTIDGAQDSQVYIDDVVVYQQFPLGSKVVDDKEIGTLSEFSMVGPAKTGSETTGYRNVTLFKPVQASSELGNYKAENAVDGIWDTGESRWLSLYEGTQNVLPPHWLEIDLQGTFEINRAEVWTGHPVDGITKAAVRSFKLQYWDDGGWEDIPGASIDNNRPGNPKVEFEFANAVTTNKVRFYSDEMDNVRVREVFVFGVPTG